MNWLPERQLGIYEPNGDWLYFIGRYRSASYWADRYQQAKQTRVNIRLIRHPYELSGLQDKTMYLTHDWFEVDTAHELVKLIESYYGVAKNLTLKSYTKLEEELNVRIQSQTNPCN